MVRNVHLAWSIGLTMAVRLNTRLEVNGLPPMTNLVDDLSDGVRLIQVR
jgi:hypothetical protein